jgi:dUTP pyrophosphatase
MIKAKYILADPLFKPTKSVDRSAGYDIRAYLADVEPIDLVHKSFFGSSGVCIDGKLIDHQALTNSKLEEYDQFRRFVAIQPGERSIVYAGFKVGLSTDSPNKIATMLVCPRSGLACNHGVTVINSPGVVDEQYPHWVGVGLINHSPYVQLFSHGARIAQVLFVEVDDVEESIVDQLEAGDRKGGFGHTGIA